MAQYNEISYFRLSKNIEMAFVAKLFLREWNNEITMSFSVRWAVKQDMNSRFDLLGGMSTFSFFQWIFWYLPSKTVKKKKNTALSKNPPMDFQLLQIGKERNNVPKSFWIEEVFNSSYSIALCSLSFDYEFCLIVSHRRKKLGLSPCIIEVFFMKTDNCPVMSEGPSWFKS